MDGDNREQVSYLPTTAGGVVMPPVPPRSFPPGSNKLLQLLPLLGRQTINIKYLHLTSARLCVCVCNNKCFFCSSGHFLMHCDAYHHQNSDPPPALPVRSLRKVQPRDQADMSCQGLSDGAAIWKNKQQMFDLAHIFEFFRLKIYFFDISRVFTSSCLLQPHLARLSVLTHFKNVLIFIHFVLLFRFPVIF